MPADIIQARYDQLDSVATRFARSAHDSADMHKRIARCVQTLQGGGWEGAGAAAFFSEMQGTIDPAMQRLVQALEAAHSATLEAKNILHAAEEEAGRVFGSEMAEVDKNSRNDVLGAIAGGIIGGMLGGPLGVIIGADIGEKLGASSKKVKIDYTLLNEKDGKNARDFNIKYAFADGELGKKTFAQGNKQIGPLNANGVVKGSFGEYEAGIGAGVNKDGQLSVGAYGEITGAKGVAEGVIGDTNLGATGDVEVEMLHGEIFAGVHNGEVGLEAGVKFVSVSGDVGVNVAGANVGLHGEVGIKAELGLTLSSHKFEVKLPFFSFGVSLGKAKTGRAG